jgi:hypothetical protein
MTAGSIKTNEIADKTIAYDPTSPSDYEMPASYLWTGVV